MNTPDLTTLIASLSAMQHDADQWRNFAGHLREAARVAGRLDLGPFHFSFIADRLGMTGLYREVQDRMVQLLMEAAQTHDDLAAALDTAADTYYVDDVAGMRRLEGIQSWPT